MIFLSILGTQALAIINPLLSMIQYGPMPEKVVLLATATKHIQEDKSQLWKNAVDHLTERMKTMGCHAAVSVRTISKSLKTDDQGNPPAQEFIAELLEKGDHPIAFNLAGGMNFQVAACVQAMIGKGGLFIYPEQTGIYVIENDQADAGLKAIWKLPEAEDVLQLQGLAHEVLSSTNSRHIRKLFEKCGFAPPADPERAIKINQEVFDFYWNGSNTLYFIKVLLGEEAKKENFRRLVAQVNDRDFFHDLYHKQVAVYTTSALVAERIDKESLGGIKLIKFGNKPDEAKARCQDLQNFMRRDIDNAQKQDYAVETFGHPEGLQTALVTSLGADPLPTMTAVWSIRPDHLILLYTPNDDNICRYKKAFTAARHTLGAKALTFVPVGLLGHECLDFRLPKGLRASVNITPGTKGHGAMLSLWAARNGADITSIEREGIYHYIYHYKDHTVSPSKAPPPESVLVLSGHRLESAGADASKLKKDHLVYDAITKVLKNIEASGFKIESSFYREIGKYNKDFKGNLSIPANDGEWFERYVGYCMCRCGADDVRVRLRTDWSDGAVKRDNAFMTDIDVVARFGTTYLVIECKVPFLENEKLNEAAEGVKAVALGHFGRFARPMLCMLKSENMPEQVGGVNSFGYKTLIDGNLLRTFIDKVIKSKITTS
jgi:hypothetical protein